LLDYLGKFDVLGESGVPDVQGSSGILAVGHDLGDLGDLGVLGDPDDHDIPGIPGAPHNIADPDILGKLGVLGVLGVHGDHEVPGSMGSHGSIHSPELHYPLSASPKPPVALRRV